MSDAPPPSDLRRMPLKEIMTARVYSVTPDWSLLTTARLLRNHHISGVPVIDRHDRVVGVISETDLANDLHSATGLGSIRGMLDLVLAAGGFRGRELVEQCLNRLKHTKVAQAMRSPPICIDLGATVEEAAGVMHARGVNRLPVTDAGQLVGIVTRQDVVSALKRTALPKAPAGRGRFVRGPA